ncbi:hypothetical protein [Frankia sp. AiPa1]|uniref:hypothetical protein n=1 Tax=Frankia sp. AiPa1 TaxID=573492 RepID=UPI00202AFCC6|nr:hypothetical protein [Frankia sp. AiPa1]MCL9762689.1 hypothetical protein [Frankia sp. AiPa1]
MTGLYRLGGTARPSASFDPNVYVTPYRPRHERLLRIRPRLRLVGARRLETLNDHIATLTALRDRLAHRLSPTR